MPAFLGPAYDRDGAPLLVAALTTRGVSSEAHRRRTRLVVDDYGNAVMHQRRCVACKGWRPLTLDVFAARNSDKTLGMHGSCVQCTKAYKAMERKYNGDRVRERNRQGYHRRMADPEYKARVLAEAKAAKAARRDRDPEAFYARENARAAEYRRRLADDPERLARLRETSRMGYRLRRERMGDSLDNIRSLPVKRKATDRASGHLPVAPLVVAVDKFIATNEVYEKAMPEMVGVHQRQINTWRGEYSHVQFAVAQRVLTKIDMFWWEVWTPDVEGYQRAHDLFEGDLAQAA